MQNWSFILLIDLACVKVSSRERLSNSHLIPRPQAMVESNEGLSNFGILEFLFRCFQFCWKMFIIITVSTNRECSNLEGAH